MIEHSALFYEVAKTQSFKVYNLQSLTVTEYSQQ